MKRFIPLIAALVATAALAHDDATLDRVKAPHGGQLRMAGAYHLELVVARDNKEARESPVTVFVTDHADNKIPTQGMSATVNLLAGKTKAAVTLQSDGGNGLKGLASYPSVAGMKAVVTLRLPDGRTEQARFSPLAASSGGHVH